MSGPKRVIPLPTPERVRALIRYDGSDFYWLPRPRSYFRDLSSFRSFDVRIANQKAAIKHQLNGYNGIRIDKALILVHRLIWVLHYGEWPKGELDHINGDRNDNSIANLRDVSKSVNMRNQKRRCDNTSGMPGVYWAASRKCWRVNVATPEKRHYIGSFQRLEDAISARKAAQLRYGFTARHGCDVLDAMPPRKPIAEQSSNLALSPGVGV